MINRRGALFALNCGLLCLLQNPDGCTVECINRVNTDNGMTRSSMRPRACKLMQRSVRAGVNDRTARFCSPSFCLPSFTSGPQPPARTFRQFALTPRQFTSAPALHLFPLPHPPPPRLLPRQDEFTHFRARHTGDVLKTTFIVQLTI